MKIRKTPKMIVLRYKDYQTKISQNETRTGPADVYFLISDFKKAASHYGWGFDREPTDTVQYMGDIVPLIEILWGSIEPVRIRYL